MHFSKIFCLPAALFISWAISCSSTGSKVELGDKPDIFAAPKGNTSINWNPNVLVEDFMVESLEVFKNVDLGIKPLSDARTNKDNIGTVTSNGQPKTVIPDSDISSWCTKNLISGLKFLGLKSVAKNGSFSFEGEVSTFSIQQDITMRGEIGLSLSCSKDGLTVWEGRIQGHSELYVIPSGSDGISECMSNTLINAIYNLLNDKSFVDAVKKSK